MKNTKILFLIFILFFAHSCSLTKIKDNIWANTKKDEIVVETNLNLLSSPKKKEITLSNFEPWIVITSPFLLKWKVPTNWIFEWVFPIKLVTSSGGVIFAGQGKANIFDKNENVIEPIVDFESSIEFTRSLDQWIYTGKLILWADNPSGLLENDDRVEVEVLISQ